MRGLALTGSLWDWYKLLQSISEPLQAWSLEALLECRVEVWDPQLQGELHDCPTSPLRLLSQVHAILPNSAPHGHPRA